MEPGPSWPPLNKPKESCVSDHPCILSAVEAEEPKPAPPVKKGTMWAMPIMPKMPQKPVDKGRHSAGSIKGKIDITNKISEKLAAGDAAGIIRHYKSIVNQLALSPT